MVFSTNNYNIDGSITTVTGTDGNGNETTSTTEPNENYFYVKIGELTETDGSSLRELTYDSGLLGTEKAKEEAGGWSEMWELDKLSTPWLIRAKQWLAGFTVKGFVRLVGGFIFSKGIEGDDKIVSDIKRSVDNDDEVPVSDDNIATSKYVDNRLEGLNERFLRKDQDDRSAGTIASDKGFVVGDFNEGTLGSGASTYMRNGSSYSEVDYLKVRKKATFTNLTIQELKHIGGELILSPAAMTISKVEDVGSGWKCYFEDTDADGRKINQEFEVNDQVMCRTFNLENNRYYWRLVTEAPTDKNYIVIAKEPCDDNSDEPQIGDNIAQLGNKYNTDRQAAIILSAYGSNAPSYTQYSGIDSFSLEGKQVTKLSPYGNEITGKVTIEKGSKGWENLEGLNEAFDSLEYGKNNILRNSGFTGDYLTAVLNGSTDLKDTSEMFSPSLKHWNTDKATAQESEISESGKEVFIGNGGGLEQTLYFKMVKDDKYVFSFRGKGGKVTYSVGGRTYMFELTEEWAQYIDKFTATDDGDLFSLEVNGDCTLCELQLERGTVKSAWGISPLDNRSELAKYDSLTYLANAMKGSTEIYNGLINTGLINMGEYDEKGNMTEVTAGMNGLYNEESSVAFWAGGDSKQANFAVSTYLDNPNYTPTQDELRQMAKFVVTHGGRAILNDVILRGYIYALGGFFKGEVNAEKGIFKNIQSPNGHFRISDNGDVEIVGKVETSVNGKRIVIDADTNSIILYDQIGRETAKIAFSEGLWPTGFVSLKQFNGESTDVVAEATITPHYSTYKQNGFKTSFGFDGMNIEKENDGEILMKVGLNPYGSGVNIEGYDPIFMVDDSIGITESFTINAFYATHSLVFKDGLLVGYTRTNNDN